MFDSVFTRIKRNCISKNNWLSFFSGLSLVFAYAPYSQWWLVFLALPLFFYHLDLSSVKETTKQCFIFGVGWFASGISWVHVSIDQFGGMPLAISLTLMLMLCLYLAIFPAIAGFLSARFAHGTYYFYWLFVPCWIFTEWLRSWFLTGFPWLSLGYSQIDSPLSVLAPVIGEVGITLAMLVIVTAFTSLLKRQQQKRSLLLLGAIVAVIATVGQIEWTEPTQQVKKVALVQGNIAQELKWAPEQEWPSMLKYLDLTRKNYDADIVVWPESAIPTVEPLAGEFLDIANQGAAINNAAIITGILDYNMESKQAFNSLVVLGKKYQDDTEGSYYYPSSNRFYKHHLLPIGEFVPFQEFLRPLAPFFNLPQSSFTRGQYVQPNLIAQGLHIAPLICFEIAFPEQLAANFTNQTDLLLTVSNDAWFGDSHGPHQHMDIARMRALEFGRPLLRSTNTGITAIVDHQGQYIARIPQFEEAVLKADVPLVSGRTPFSYLERYPTFILSFILFISIMLSQRKNSPNLSLPNS
ncbi:apolipoprotein N-acyltransferase [Thalassotalea atypica]|uniref:apolipoprotein N-acyltransferase n=1 Tax=Thalassotalea atypica TaxID=2054316 RepID=UPI0025748AC6|nr:apolipoprotein N-acyltransferase [Thalassotalea atypica]